jgi:protein kinase-like protein
VNDAMLARWQDVARVVDLVLDLEAADRPELLERACSGDAALRREVERLLAASERAADFLGQPVAADAAPLVSWVERQESQALAAGTRFGVYEVRGVLGRGGMATVYLAQDHKHHRTVAVKVFDAGVGAALRREWFLREIDIAAGLHHPHILPLHDSGEVDGRLYYVMPHVEGESLRQRLLREREVPLASARRIVQEVAGALDHAHRQHVVHRDIKPENILLQDGQAIVADFGIARAIDAGVVEAGATETIPALGTPAYMSPEQATRTADIDGRTDIYALGCVLYEMLAGTPAFNGPTVQAVLDQHTQDPVPSLRTVRPDIPLRLERAIACALQKAPADRFATADEFVKAIDLAAGESAPGRAGRRAVKWIVAAIAVSVIVTIGAIAGKRGKGTPVRLDPELVAILPFRLESTNPTLAWLRQGAADLLANKLAGSGGLRAADSRSVRSAWDRVAGASGQELTPAAGRNIALRVGAGRLIDGSIVGTPEHLTLTASLITTPDGAESAHTSVEGSSDSLPALLDRLAARLLALAAGRDSLRLSWASTAYLPALRAYLAGRDAFRAGRLNVAASRLEQATILDSTFALAAMELVHVSLWTGGGEAVTRAKRLALAGRERLDPADRALLDIWTGPFVTGPQWIEQWQAASAAYPDRPETWYELGDVYYHQGLSVGIADPFRLAAEAFQRGWVIDSASAGGAVLAERSPMVAEPLKHMVELAQSRHDTASVLRLVALGLAADSTSKQGWYLRWHRAVALGASAQRSFWADSQSVDPEAFGAIFEFIEFSGVAAQDYVRAANLDIRHWEASGPAGGSFERGMVALDGGRPRESARYLAEIENAGVHTPGQRPQGWRLGEGEDPGLIHLALYWGADTVRAAEAARRLAPLARGPSLTGNGARDQLEARCVVATWRAARGDYAYADAAVRRLTEARVRGLHGVDSVTVDGFRRLCAALLDATRATALRLPDSRQKLEQADAASRNFDLFLPAVGANLVVAHLAELQGDLPFALRAVRRRAGFYGFFPSWHLSTFLREEGRLAALTGDRLGAIRAYQHYLALRTHPEPEVKPEVDSVRAELARLLEHRRR